MWPLWHCVRQSFAACCRRPVIRPTLNKYDKQERLFHSCLLLFPRYFSMAHHPHPSITRSGWSALNLPCNNVILQLKSSSTKVSVSFANFFYGFSSIFVKTALDVSNSFETSFRCSFELPVSLHWRTTLNSIKRRCHSRKDEPSFTSRTFLSRSGGYRQSSGFQTARQKSNHLFGSRSRHGFPTMQNSITQLKEQAFLSFCFFLQMAFILFSSSSFYWSIKHTDPTIKIQKL